jgi:hypothetical protein
MEVGEPMTARQRVEEAEAAAARLNDPWNNP